MAEASANFHEPIDRLRESTLEHHRGIVSLMEELEAIDWYQQRIDATEDEELKAILVHNRDEEKEHAAMSLEWLRRRDPGLDAELRDYLFTDGPIAGTDDDHDHDDGSSGTDPASDDGSLGIGSLRQEGQR